MFIKDLDLRKLFRKEKQPIVIKLKNIFVYLGENGYSRQDLGKITQKNILRIFKETWKK